MSGDVHPFSPPPVSSNGHGSGGGGHDERLRALEIQTARLEEQVRNIRENMAEKNDMTSLKVWILGGVLSAIVVGAAIAATVVKAFL